MALPSLARYLGEMPAKYLGEMSLRSECDVQAQKMQIHVMELLAVQGHGCLGYGFDVEWGCHCPLYLQAAV
jgi:hypothetical protein